MSIPSGVETVQVSCLPTTVGLIQNVTVTAIPTQNLIWAATGQSLASMCNISPIPGWLILPAVDQTGFVTSDTHIGVTGWSYIVNVAWTTNDGASGTESGTIQVLSSQATEYLVNSGSTLQVRAPGFPNTLLSMLVMPSAEYSALAPPDPDTLYFTY